MVTADIYMELLTAWHYAMEEKFQHNYKNNIRFCFNQLYRLIVDTLMGRDISSIHTVSSPEIPRESSLYHNHNALNGHPRLNVSINHKEDINQIYTFLGSLEECLCDETGKICFKKFLEEQFCVVKHSINHFGQNLNTFA